MTLRQVTFFREPNFVASSARVALATPGNFRATIRNPINHVRNMWLMRLVMFVSQGPAFAHLYINPTDGLPTSQMRPVNHLRVGNPALSPAEIRADTNTLVPLGGGIDTGIELALPGGTVSEEFSSLLIPPNVTLGINVPFAGASNVVLTAYWHEEI